MPFRTILKRAQKRTPGLLAAMFLDYEGEAVEVLSDAPAHDAMVIGAYQGIFLNQIKRLCREQRLGHLSRFTLRLEGMTILTSPMEDGYYLVFLLDSSAREGAAWRALDRARAALLEEM